MLKRVGIAVVAVLLATTGPASGQDAPTGAAGAGAPRFLLADAGQPLGHVDVAPNTVPVLRRRVSLSARQVSIIGVLKEIGQRLDVMFSYDPAVSGLERRMTFRADGLTLAAALTEVLFETGLDVLVVDGRHLALVPRVHVRGRVGLGGTVLGRVKDAKTGASLANVDVALASTKWHVTTDTAGRYRLADVDSGTYTLTARRIGYAKQSRKVTIRSEHEDTVDLALAPVATRLDELVTTATGRRRRVDVPNDITTINVDSVMQAAPVHSVTDLLEHRVPGLMVQHTSGAPGDPARLRLRGAGSPLQNNDPIVVVDGVRVYAKQSDARSGNLANGIFSNTAAPSPLDYLDPNSIETIEVVKGPSAATLYGPDAANGVIVITTKKGHAGPTRWTMNAVYGRTQLPGRYPDLLNRRGHDLYDNQSLQCTLTAGPACIPDSTLTFQMLNDPALTMLGHGHTTNLSLGASGGNQAINYSLTGSFEDELGIVKLPDFEATRYQAIEGTSPPEWMRRPERYKRWNATSTITARLGEKADVTLSTSLSRQPEQKSTLETQLGTFMATFFDPNSGLYYGSGGAGVADFNIVAYRTRVTDVATHFENSVSANWRARPWLTGNATAGLDVQQRADESLLPRSRDSLSMEASHTTGQLSAGTGTVLTSTVRAGAVAIAPLGGQFKFRFAAGADYTGTAINDITLNSACLPYGSTTIANTCGSGAGLTATRNTVDDASFGWYLAPAITHPRLSVDLGLRLDGGSRYGSGVSGLKLPTFPKLGFSYLLSDESWFPFKSVIQSFRVRTAYGRAGRQPGPADRLRLYSRTFSDLGTGDYVTLSTLGNTELKPERTAEFEGGFDADLLDGRLGVNLTGYRKTTADAILSVPLPPSVYGLNSSTMRNIGVIRNTGLELTADAQLVRGKAMTWSTRFTLTQNRNTVVRLGPGVLPFYTEFAGATDGGSLSSDFTGTRVAAGYPLFGRWARPVVGYADANGNGVLEPGEIMFGDTAVYVGRQEPDYTLTVEPSVSLGHGALILTAQLAHDGGLAQMNQVAQRLARFTAGSNDPTASLARQLATGTVGADIASNWVQTVAATRFQNVSVSYRVPGNVARRLGTQQLNIAVQGSNLGLWTNYRGLDPNVNAFATGNSVADAGMLPMPRTWQVRLNAVY